MIDNKRKTYATVTAVGTLGFNKEKPYKKNDPIQWGQGKMVKEEFGYKNVETVTDKLGKITGVKTVLNMFIKTEDGRMFYFKPEHTLKDNAQIYVGGEKISESLAQDPTLLAGVKDHMLRTNINIEGFELKSLSALHLVKALEEHKASFEGLRVRIELNENYRPYEDKKGAGTKMQTSHEVKKIVTPYESDVDTIKYRANFYAKNDLLAITPDNYDGSLIDKIPAKVYITTQQKVGDDLENKKGIYADRLVKFEGINFNSCLAPEYTQEERNDLIEAINSVIAGQMPEDGMWYEIRVEGEFKSGNTVKAGQMTEEDLTKQQILLIKMGKTTLADLNKAKFGATKDSGTYIGLEIAVGVKTAFDTDLIENTILPTDMYVPVIKTAETTYVTPVAQAPTAPAPRFGVPPRM